MPVFHRPDDVLRTPRRVAAEEDVGVSGLHRLLVDDRHSVRVEFDADVALDPRECVFLADRKNDVVAWENDGLDYLALLLPAFLEPAKRLELETDEATVLQNKAFRRVVLDDLDAFLFSVL